MSTSLVDALVEMAVAFDAEANRVPMHMPRFRPYTRYMAPGARWLSQFRGQVYVIEGNIGSGKTTLGHLLTAYFTQRGLKAVFLPEKVPEAVSTVAGTVAATEPSALSVVSSRADRRTLATWPGRTVRW